jgi:colanic acid biosynthesis protein WcaH
MNLTEALRVIHREIGDPSQGLPEDVFLFVSRVSPMVNVDLLIQDENGRTLLTWREDKFFGSGWHIPGAIIRFKERAIDRVHKCAEEELSATVAPDAKRLIVVENIDERATDRAHFVSMLYRCRLTSDLDPSQEAGNQPQPGQWRWHTGCPDDLLPVHRIYRDFLTAD